MKHIKYDVKILIILTEYYRTVNVVSIVRLGPRRMFIEDQCHGSNEFQQVA
jgi:hypothetical protein